MIQFDGTKLKELRRAKGWTQGELGGMLGKKTEHISSYENGYANPPFGTLVQLLDIFGIEAEDLSKPGELDLAA